MKSQSLKVDHRSQNAPTKPRSRVAPGKCTHSVSEIVYGKHSRVTRDIEFRQEASPFRSLRAMPSRFAATQTAWDGSFGRANVPVSRERVVPRSRGAPWAPVRAPSSDPPASQDALAPAASSKPAEGSGVPVTQLDVAEVGLQLDEIVEIGLVARSVGDRWVVKRRPSGGAVDADPHELPHPANFLGNSPLPESASGQLRFIWPPRPGRTWSAIPASNHRTRASRGSVFVPHRSACVSSAPQAQP